MASGEGIAEGMANAEWMLPAQEGWLDWGQHEKHRHQITDHWRTADLVAGGVILCAGLLWKNKRITDCREEK